MIALSRGRILPASHLCPDKVIFRREPAAGKGRVLHWPLGSSIHERLSDRALPHARLAAPPSALKAPVTSDPNETNHSLRLIAFVSSLSTSKDAPYYVTSAPVAPDVHCVSDLTKPNEEESLLSHLH